MDAARIAVIGARRMGRPILDRLVAAGHEPTVLTRRPAARGADVVVTVVFDDEQLRAAVLGEDGVIASMAAGGVLVQHTTCDPSTIALLIKLVNNALFVAQVGLAVDAVRLAGSLGSWKSRSWRPCSREAAAAARSPAWPGWARARWGHESRN